MVNPEAGVQVAHRSIEVFAHRLPEDVAYRELLDYRRRHPLAVRMITPFTEIHLVTDEQVRIAAKIVPLIELRAVHRGSDEATGNRQSAPATRQ
jgi:hypothetical protein